MKRAGVLYLGDWHHITFESAKTEQKEKNDNSSEPPEWLRQEYGKENP
jgi:hypothetical protein